MLYRILLNDLRKNKLIAFILLVFVSLSAFLIVMSAQMIMQLNCSQNYLFQQADIPHFVQMHEGQIDQNSIIRWANSNKELAKFQIVKLLKIDNSYIYLGNNNQSEASSVMNLYFVVQNKNFDFLPNLQGKIVYPAAGEIEAPLYFMLQNHLRVGDKIRIATAKNITKTFTIVGFVRDAQMNPALVHSKRFVINPIDFDALQATQAQNVYFIELQLKNLANLSLLSNAYQSANLPQNGPTLTYHLYKILNLLSDGMLIGITILTGSFIILIALLCLRLIILASIEEDYRQIATMKAIGISSQHIINLYLSKYMFISGLGCCLGYLCAFICKHYFTKSIIIYFGNAPLNAWSYLVPIMLMSLIFLLISGFCMLVLKRFHRISVISALQQTVTTRAIKNKVSMKMPLNINILLGVCDILQQYKVFISLFFVFVFCSFIVILPLNFYNTLKSPTFITYMGIGRCDIRIDLSRINAKYDLAEKIINYLKNDKQVSRYALMTTGRFKLEKPNGTLDNINIETGNFSAFPLQYLRGYAPQHPSEIALSYLSSKQLQLDIGAQLKIFLNNKAVPMLVTGIYQDITNGGQTAKSVMPIAPEQRLWQVINVNLRAGINIDNKINEYQKLFHSAKIVHLNDYLTQTLGDLIYRVKLAAVIALIISLAISVLITSLFLKMLVAKQARQIAIMKMIGFNINNIRIQYLTKILLVLILGIVTGVLLTNTVGQYLVNILWSVMGAAKVSFVINPIQIDLLCPLLLIIAVSVFSLLNLLIVKKIHISNLIVE